MNPETIESMVREVINKMSSMPAKGDNTVTSAPPTQGVSAKVSDYPLAKKHPEWVKTKSNKTLDDITLESVLNGSINSADLRITPEVLRLQASIARDAGRERLAVNFERAAELTSVPDARVLEIYNALRPYRSTKAELLAIADELERQYQARVCANYIREAAELYVERKKLKGDD